LLTALSIAHAQTFEAATIKPSSSSDRRPFFNIQPRGRFSASNVTVNG
jgi:hypothetical protein